MSHTFNLLSPGVRSAELRPLQRRDRAFLQVCHRILSQHVQRGLWPHGTAVVRQALQQPAPEYYVDYEHTLTHLNHYFNGGQQQRSAMCRERLREIADRVDECLRREPRLSRGQALSRILTTGQASRFFIPYEQAVRMYYRYFPAY